MLQFVFFGRLVKEKGIDIIIDVVQRFIDDQNNNKNKQLSQTQLFICGDGPYKQKVLKLAQKTSNLHFFGRCNQSQLVQKIASSHYTLMPSVFLETFGLSALESLSLGVPVIGFSKGGLTNFIPSHLDINKQEGKNNIEKLYNLINFLINTNSETKIQKNTQQSLDVAKHYFPDNWIKNFKHLTPNPSPKQRRENVLLISDYKTIYGGIETYLYKTKKILEENGYQCNIWGANFGKGIIGSILRKIGFFGSFFNIFSGIKLYFYIKKNKPDLLRRNSCLRMLGRVPLRMQRKFRGKQRMMYHDLGYFHPFPSQVEQTKQIPQKWSVSSFCKTQSRESRIKKRESKIKKFLHHITNIPKNIFVAGKFVLLNLLKKQLKNNIDLHLVPSSFLKVTVRELYKLEENSVKVFPHCLDKFFVGVSDGMKKAQKDKLNKNNKKE